MQKKEGPDTSARFKEIKAILKKYNYDNGITPEITVSILEDLGPTFVKLGQIASQQTEYIPPEWAKALAQLRSNVTPMDIDTVHSQIEKYLGKPVNELFSSFDDKPLGSASIAQVHKAALKDGTVVMQDAYALKRTVLQVAQPKGEINHGNVLEMCEGICGQYIGADFGDFDLGDLLGTVLGGLQDENYKVDPFLTNLARGIIAVEGTIQTLSTKVNILNYFTDKVDTGLDFNLDLEHPENMNPDIAMKLLKLFNGVTNASNKKAETLDMLEKGQIKVRTDFSFEEKGLEHVSRLTQYAVRGLLIIAFFIGSCLLCMASAMTVDPVFMMVFRVLGLVGYGISVFFVWRLYRNMKKNKKK